MRGCGQALQRRTALAKKLLKNYRSHLKITPELSRADLRPRQGLKIQKSAEAAKRSRLERIVS